MKKSKLLFTPNFPRLKDLGEEFILIYDEILPKKSAVFKKWSLQFERRYAVKAGESLKAIENFPRHISKILELCESASSRKLTLVAVGGGSVGDFGGFVASVLKRGVRLVHIPSTWLSAFDSAHGGKTALNGGGAKNQIGTFYPAAKIVLVKSLLLSQPETRAFEGFGELLKISLLEGRNLWKSIAPEKEVSAKMLWKYLPLAIQAKYKVVAQDPEEKTGYRHILNLGHTLGHVLEVCEKLPHGVSINYGLDFALRWSLGKKIMSSIEFKKIYHAPIAGFLLSPGRDDLLPSQEKELKKFSQLLHSDKKKTQRARLRFVFLKKPGQSVIREVAIDEILVEVCRQREEGLYG